MEGKFILGCNYFSSSAGLHMWNKWDEKSIEKDLMALKKNGMEVIRIFPIWSDFQPLKPHYTNVFREMRLDEKPFDNTPEGKAGVAPIMGERYKKFLKLAEKHGLKLIIELITGWMSGRNLRPVPFLNVNVFSDPLCLKWQVRLVEYLVETGKSSKSVIAWGLGNECNCMNKVKSRDEAWVWTALITKTIKAKDPTRPVMSGMHGLAVESNEIHWHLKDQGELNDILNIHPYPYYTPHVFRDTITGIRTILHAAAESRMTTDLGGKPCLSQEVGILGPMFASDELGAEYLESVIWSLWTCGDLGCLWWIAFDCEFPETPYDWNATERELGFMDINRLPKPVLKKMTNFNKSLKSLPLKYRFLPENKKEVTCILTRWQDNWGVAYATFILSKQAGFDVKFNGPEDELPQSEIYFMPSIQSVTCCTSEKWKELVEKVKQGANLYISMSNAVISSFKNITGLEVQTKQQRTKSVTMITNSKEKLSIPIYGTPYAEPLKYNFKSLGAEILATEEDGTPLFTKYRLGKGTVYFLGTNLEAALINTPGVFDDEKLDYASIYRVICEKVINKRLIRKKSYLKYLSLSEHYFPGNKEAVCVGINHGTKKIDDCVILSKNAKKINVLRGNIKIENNQMFFSLNPHDAFVVELKL